jgi:hypothetical protein
VRAAIDQPSHKHWSPEDNSGWTRHGHGQPWPGQKITVSTEYRQKHVRKLSLNKGSFQANPLVYWASVKLETVFFESQVQCVLCPFNQFREQLTFNQMFKKDVFFTSPCLTVRKFEWIIFPEPLVVFLLLAVQIMAV